MAIELSGGLHHGAVAAAISNDLLKIRLSLGDSQIERESAHKEDTNTTAESIEKSAAAPSESQ